MKKYANIVFIQRSDETQEPEKIYNEQGEKALFDYLLQWDYGHESETDISVNEPWGKYDKNYHFDIGNDHYIVSVNTGMPYFGLVRIINE